MNFCWLPSGGSFSMEFQSTGRHSFKLAYDPLKSVSYGKSRIVLEGSTIPDGRIELKHADNNPSPSLAEVYAKKKEYRKLRGPYLRAKPAGPRPVVPLGNPRHPRLFRVSPDH